MVWPSQFRGTAIRVRDGYREKPLVVKKKHALTEAQDNAIGRQNRRRQNKGDERLAPARQALTLRPSLSAVQV